jgi:hypothetical protein
MIKAVWVKRVRYAAYMGEMRHAHKILVGYPEETTWENLHMDGRIIIKMDLTRIGCEERSCTMELV